MALLSIIRRWHLRDHLPIREIARRTGLSRNRIRKYLRAGTVEPRFKVPERPSKLDPFAERLPASTADERAWHLCAVGVRAGKAFQFDWSEDWAIIDGVRTKLQVARDCQ